LWQTIVADNLNVPIHEGVTAYFDRNKPNFIEAHASFLSLLLSGVTLVGSGLLGLRVKILQNQKDQTE
jgi:hypothetical protein